MSIKTIAEHVENESTLRRLNEIGVNFVQGFHFGLPKPIGTLQLEHRPKGVSEQPAIYLTN
jgi:EAL domain-containing protein (putative c-di-GMP-specific phosphodiesterase class I)